MMRRSDPSPIQIKGVVCVSIETFQAGFDANRMNVSRSACPHPEGSAERQIWTDGWDTRDSHISNEPLINQIYVDAIGDILRQAYSETVQEPLTVEMIMLLLEIGITSEVENIKNRRNAVD
jgi:hypothetical protein